jgi:hypothetical protein
MPMTFLHCTTQRSSRGIGGMLSKTLHAAAMELLYTLVRHVHDYVAAACWLAV